MAELADLRQSVLERMRAESAKVRSENYTLKADPGYWKYHRERAVVREDQLKKELRGKNERIAYLTRQLYERKSGQKKAEPEGFC
jgi:hypothetical protein